MPGRVQAHAHPLVLGGLAPAQGLQRHLLPRRALSTRFHLRETPHLAMARAGMVGMPVVMMACSTGRTGSM